MTKIIKSKGGVNERRKRVIARLEKQLKLGKKPVSSAIMREAEKHGIYTKLSDMTDPLTDTDRERIEKELATLKSRII